LPEEVQSLLSLAEIRVICKRLSIASLKEHSGSVTAEFSKVAKISVEKLLRLIRESGGRVKLDPHRPNVLVIKTGNIGLREKSEFIRERLASLLN
jgi:transcription-repair coupling factor (superfamily II helicase)